MGKGMIRTVVVEDEKRLARNIAKHIEENPAFQVCEIFSNGEDAWEYIRQNPPGLVVTDISMPLMDGIELASHIHDAQLAVRCVILTGYADFQYAQAALRADVEDYLLKPVNTEELGRLLRRIELEAAAQASEALSLGKDETHTPEEIVTLVKKYVEKNYSKEISLNILAANLGFSPSYLTKVFNKVEGCTPSVYIREFRMKKARQLLGHPAATVVSVAEAVGYTDPFHFSKYFKHTFGYPPSAVMGSAGMGSAEMGSAEMGSDPFNKKGV